MKQIAIMGLCNYENMGDQIIAKCVNYLVEQIGDAYKGYYVNFQPERSGYRYEIYKKLRKIVEKKGLGELEHKCIYLIMKWFVFKYYKQMLREADALILACGSFKYGTQNLWTTYSIAVEYAKKYNVPVMFDAMNIQKYDQDDWRCRFLAKHANYENVKMITTRDGDSGVERLKEDYIKRKDIVLLPVGDPALWIKECYKIVHKARDVVGINLIREGIFKDYGSDVSDDTLYTFYQEIIQELESKGIKWELFTNGMKCDLNFGNQLLERCHLSFDAHPIKVPQNDRELVGIIGSYSSIIGARLHACICAYSLNTPFAGYIWDEKLIHYAEETNTMDYFCNIQELDGKRIIEKLNLAIQNGFDQEIKAEWKNKTKSSIQSFLKTNCK